MAEYYDTIMTSGYYDYKKIVDSLLRYSPVKKTLEIGCGTGLILEELAKRKATDTIVGIDLTESMLNIAQKRLQPFPNVTLLLQNVLHLTLPEKYDLAFSYGGVWYFVMDGDKEPVLISHIPDDAGNHQGFAQVAEHISKNGILLLGIQGPHYNYEKVIANGMTYSQEIIPCDNGFIKNYHLTDKSKSVMSQTTDYRTYSFTEALALLAKHGFEYQPTEKNDGLFLQFKKI
jgi:SAM-dependent methyltransferase